MSVWIPYRVLTPSVVSYILLSESLLYYPGPTLTSGTLRLKASEVRLNSDNTSYVNIPGSGQSEWITFDGSFGHFPDPIQLSYSDGVHTFACHVTADPTVVNGPIGSIEPNRAVCRTSTAEPFGEYVFTVTLGTESGVGLDSLFFPAIPVVTRVRGCDDDVDTNGTYNCPTNGGETLTIDGRFFNPDMVKFF